jgi:hypothetical protein
MPITVPIAPLDFVVASIFNVNQDNDADGSIVFASNQITYLHITSTLSLKIHWV